MSVKPNIPMKFECAHCNKIYLDQYQHIMRPHYPDCPNCEQPGLLLGIAVIEDLFKHPVSLGVGCHAGLTHGKPGLGAAKY